MCFVGSDLDLSRRKILFESNDATIVSLHLIVIYFFYFITLNSLCNSVMH